MTKKEIINSLRWYRRKGIDVKMIGTKAELETELYKALSLYNQRTKYVCQVLREIDEDLARLKLINQA